MACSAWIQFVHLDRLTPAGNQGAQVDRVQILRSGKRRGVTRSMKTMIKRRSANDPTIEHMKMDGKLGRNPLKGSLGDALHAERCRSQHSAADQKAEAFLLTIQPGFAGKFGKAAAQKWFAVTGAS